MINEEFNADDEQQSILRLLYTTRGLVSTTFRAACLTCCCDAPSDDFLNVDTSCAAEFVMLYDDDADDAPDDDDDDDGDVDAVVGNVDA